MTENESESAVSCYCPDRSGLRKQQLAGFSLRVRKSVDRLLTGLSNQLKHFSLEALEKLTKEYPSEEQSV
jgi:hypothetical protein